MDYAACNIIYVHRAAGEDRLLKRSDASQKSPDADSIGLAVGGEPARADHPDVENNIQTLLGTFSEGMISTSRVTSTSFGPQLTNSIVYICTSGKACVAKLAELHQASLVDLTPTIVLLDIPYEDELFETAPPQLTRTPSPTSNKRAERSSSADADEAFYGLSLLQCVALDIQQHNLSKLVVPVAVVAIPSQTPAQGDTRQIAQPVPLRYYALKPSSTAGPTINTPLDQGRTMRYLDIGAVDVLTSPLLAERLPSLAIHAYRAHKEALRDQRVMLEMKRGRKRSWVGLDDQKPYAYLREAMVSGLMDGICRSGGDDLPISHVRLSVPVERREKIESSVASWNFSAHDFTDDELLHAALIMLQHALAIPALEQWRLPAGMSHPSRGVTLYLIPHTVY
jgi:3',5'-cyclic-nucleotide phosphodiesterase